MTLRVLPAEASVRGPLAEPGIHPAAAFATLGQMTAGVYHC